MRWDQPHWSGKPQRSASFRVADLLQAPSSQPPAAAEPARSHAAAFRVGDLPGLPTKPAAGQGRATSPLGRAAKQAQARVEYAPRSYV